MKSQKQTVTGNTTFAKFVIQNLDEIVKRKTEILNRNDGFLYITPNGEYKEGNHNNHGFSILANFGGYSENREKAIKDLQFQIDREPGIFYPELKKLL